jgi:hypothetical protein
MIMTRRLRTIEKERILENKGIFLDNFGRIIKRKVLGKV